VACTIHDRDALVAALGNTPLGGLVAENRVSLQQELSANKELELEEDEDIDDFDASTLEQKNTLLRKLLLAHGCVRVDVERTLRHKGLVLTGESLTRVTAVEPIVSAEVSRISKPAKLMPSQSGMDI
jgi:hypothetical protein